MDQITDPSWTFQALQAVTAASRLFFKGFIHVKKQTQAKKLTNKIKIVFLLQSEIMKLCGSVLGAPPLWGTGRRRPDLKEEAGRAGGSGQLD